MKYPVFLILFFAGITSYNNDEITGIQNDKNNLDFNNKMKITVGSAVFTAKLYDNQTTNALKAMLPITITMSELNGNEKYFQFSNKLPTNSISNLKIENGDLMLYEDNFLVVFYKSFKATYSYTRLGKIDNPARLASALGTGSVEVKFELE